MSYMQSLILISWDNSDFWCEFCFLRNGKTKARARAVSNKLSPGLGMFSEHPTHSDLLPVRVLRTFSSLEIRDWKFTGAVFLLGGQGVSCMSTTFCLQYYFRLPASCYLIYLGLLSLGGRIILRKPSAPVPAPAPATRRSRGSWNAWFMIMIRDREVSIAAVGKYS